jgi:hypothetical protein
MDIKETPEQVITRVASAFRDHFTMNRLTGGEYTQAPVELAQIAIQIHSAIVPYAFISDSDRVYNYRSFLEECGFSDFFAHDFITDDEPDAIY